MTQQFRTIHWLGITWLGNVKTSTQDASGAQDKIIAELPPDHVPVWCHHPKKGRLWGGVTFEKLKDITATNHYLFEILVPDRRRKVYFDIDPPKPKEGEQVIAAISLNEVKNIISQYFPNPRFQISGREGSWHVILSNYYADNLESTAILKQIAKKHGWDAGVYTKNRNFKCINQSKPGESVQAFIEGSDQRSKHFILHDFDDDAVNINTLAFDLGELLAVTALKKGNRTARQQCVDLLSIPQFDLPVPDDYDPKNPLHKLGLLPNPPRGSPGTLDHDICWKVMCWCKQQGIDFPQFWAWNKKKDPAPARMQKFYKSWTSPKQYRVSAKFMDSLLERFYPDINVNSATKKFQAQFRIPLLKKVDHDYFQYADISRLKSDKPTNPFGWQEQREEFIKYTLLAGGMGRNKTGAVIDYLKRYCKRLRSLWICPRITLAENTKARLQEEGLDFTCYREVDTAEKEAGLMDDCQNVVCSIQSLHYLKEPFDIVVVDEPETVLTTFYGNAETHKGNTLWRNWEQLHGFCQYAKKVIFMDAFTTNLSLNVVKGFIRNGWNQAKYEVLDTSLPPSPRQFIEVESFPDWLCHALRHLEMGERLYIFTTYKTGKKGVDAIVKTIIRTFPQWQEGSDILAYHAENEEEKRKLNDVEAIWKKCRVVVTNATISVGVNFNLKNIFDRIYGYYAPLIRVRDFIQSLHRVRYPKHNTMILHRDFRRTFGIHKKRTAWEIPDCDIFRQMLKDLDIEYDANNVTKDWATFNMFCRKAGIQILPASLEFGLEANKKYLANFAKKDDLVFYWANISDISSEEAEQLLYKSYRNDSNLDERLQLQKYYFKIRFDEDTPEVVMEAVWNAKSDFIEKVIELRLEPEHIINRLFAENGVTLGDGDPFPQRMKTSSIPLEEIQKAFKFDRKIGEEPSAVASQMINAFFGMRAYYWKPDKRKDTGQGKGQKRNREYLYETSETFVDLAEVCVQHYNKKIRRGPEDEGVSEGIRAVAQYLREESDEETEEEMGMEI